MQVGVYILVCRHHTGVHMHAHTAPGLVIMTVLAPHVATTACLKSSNFTCTSTMNKTGEGGGGIHGVTEGVLTSDMVQ